MQKNIMLENTGLNDVNPRICGYEECESGHSYGPAAREYYLLHYVDSGKGVFQSPRGRFEIGEGQAFVIRPGEVTLYTADRKTPWVYRWIGFSCTLAVRDVLCADVLDVPECAHIFRELIACEHMRDGKEWYLCGKIYELLSHLRERRAPAADRTAQYVRMAQNYIQSNYMQDLHVGQLAALLNLDRSYFSQIFKRETGKAPQQYIVDLRLQTAAELIASQGLRPGEAAQQVGYGDIFNFSRMFRRRFGVAPSRYRGG